MRRGEIAIDDLMIECSSRTVAVPMCVVVTARVVVTAAARSRPVMIGAKRAVRHKRKRRHDR